MEKVSFILPAYNAEMTIGKCLDSIIQQTYKNIEVVVINDGSSDRTEEICRSYVKTDIRIRLYNQKNSGVSNARNKGISVATGTYLQFVDADDYIEPTMTEMFVEKAKENRDAQLIICGCTSDKEGIQTVIPTSAKQNMETLELLRALMEPDSVRGYLFNKLFYKKIIDEINLRMETDIHVCEDLIFCLEYASQVKKAVYIEKPLYHYVYREDSVTHKKFSPKRFSVIDAFEQIKKISEKYQDKKLENKIEAHYLVVVLQLWVMLQRNHYSYKSEEMVKVMKNMKKRKLCLWGTNWDFKYKITCVPVKMLSLIYK